MICIQRQARRREAARVRRRVHSAEPSPALAAGRDAPLPGHPHTPCWAVAPRESAAHLRCRQSSVRQTLGTGCSHNGCPAQATRCRGNSTVNDSDGTGSVTSAGGRGAAAEARRSAWARLADKSASAASACKPVSARTHTSSHTQAGVVVGEMSAALTRGSVHAAHPLPPARPSLAMNGATAPILTKDGGGGESPPGKHCPAARTAVGRSSRRGAVGTTRQALEAGRASGGRRMRGAVGGMRGGRGALAGGAA